MESVIHETVITMPAIKLLVVDDREDNLFSIESILEKDRYQVRKARSGREALKILLKETDFTMILMDVQMPDLNGFETAELIYARERLKQIPIIFITANDHGEESIFKGYQLGGVDYIYKPINPDLLRAKVAVFVELYKKNKELKAQEDKLMAVNKNLEKEIETRKLSEEKIYTLNQQMAESIYQLKVTNKELERFAFVASHDLQEPIRKILVFSKMLRDRHQGVFDADASDLLERIIKSSTRMQQLVKNLLEFSRAALDSADFRDMDLNVLLENVLTDLDEYIADKNAVITADRLPTLKVIPDHFHQLFQNLIMNSLKFCKADTPPRITIGADRVKGIHIPGLTYDKYEDQFFRISVTDNGIGFEEKYQDQMFIVFKRLHSAGQFEGTGIGLSICKKVVERHNGYIFATGRPNEGATFTIVLPAQTQN